MKMWKIMKMTGAAWVAFLLCCGSSQAALVITFTESGSDVTVTISGSIDSMAGASIFQSEAGAIISNSVRGNDAYFSASDDPGAILYYNNYNIGVAPDDLGTTSTTLVQPITVDSISTSFFIRKDAQNPQLWLVSSYTLGTAITGSMTFANSTFADIGVAQGSYLWDWGGDSITVNVIPECSVMALSSLCATLLLLRRRRG